MRLVIDSQRLDVLPYSIVKELKLLKSSVKIFLRNLFQAVRNLVEVSGIEPLTFWLQTRRSPS